MSGSRQLAWSTVAIAAFAVATEATASAATAAEAATTPAAITATEAATATAAEAATIAPEPAAAIAVASPLVAVGLAHLDGGLGLVLVDADGDEANDVGREAHAALHLGNRRRRCVEVHQRIVRLAVLLDLERDGLETPIFCFADLAAAFGDDVAVFFRQRFDLRLTDVLAGQEYVLVERHGMAFPSVTDVRSGAKPLLGPRQHQLHGKAQRTRKSGDTGSRALDPATLDCASAASPSASNRSG